MRQYNTSPERYSIRETNLTLPDQKDFYRGKVRDVYYLEDYIVMVVSDRISAFDRVLPRPIPFKGAILNGIATHFLKAVDDIVPHWLVATPDPNVSIGKICEPLKVEMVIRGYLAGHAWREYKKGKRCICGAPMPDNMKESDRFPSPIITPATKAVDGHDEDITPAELVRRNIVTEEQYNILENNTRILFKRGTEMAADKGLLLVDTKYEFGIHNGEIILIDEIHTADSSRYYIADEYDERQSVGIAQKQLSKEFVREWLMGKGFNGKGGQEMPVMKDEFIWEISERYEELFITLTGDSVQKDLYIEDPEQRINGNILQWLENQKQ